jgi:6-phosphofructokinase 1
MNTGHDFTILSLGAPKIPSPILLSRDDHDFMANYVDESKAVLYDITLSPGDTLSNIEKKHLLERAGPREKIYFDPSKGHAAVVTCGGLCPGLNDVIRAIVMCLWYRYGVKLITGIRFGYRGLLPEFKIPSRDLDPVAVSDIHLQGGTILGSSRGHGERTSEIVDCLESMNITILFTIGGDGTQRAAMKIAEEIHGRGDRIAVVGIPKTIDNDIGFIERSFGFETAVSEACVAIAGAHTEAHDSINGIGIVKVMGRESGFIAAHAALAINDVNYVLVPEVPFELDGSNGLFAHLKDRLARRNHAVILAAEGAGQQLMTARNESDASGNKKPGDIGIFLKDRINAWFKEQNIETNIRYIDPSYMIRSAPANPNDSIYCARLGTNAVHAAMAGKTSLLIGMVNNHFVHLPIRVAVGVRNKVDPEGSLWRDVVEATGQPPLMQN